MVRYIGVDERRKMRGVEQTKGDEYMRHKEQKRRDELLRGERGTKERR